jgi:light-regulated signal transduction histidine kinase (bacteriophytochrome)
MSVWATREGKRDAVGSQKRILIVDDDEQNRELLHALIEGVGHEPALAANGAEALSKVRDDVDLVLLDVMMPGMDGFEVVRRIRQIPETADVPIIMVTVLDGKDYRLRAVEAGANDFISKPVDRTELFIRTNALLRMKEVQDAVKQHRKELERNAAELARSNRELEDFASVVSHDLQAPARQIRLFCDLLEEEFGGKLPEGAAEYVRRVHGASVQMQTLIRDLLEVSRVRTHVQAFGRVDLKRIAREVVDGLRPEIEESGGRVELGDLAILDADPTQMHQLLQNLIQNALKFRKPDVAPIVKVHCRYVGHGDDSVSFGEEICQLMVEDNGIGFDAEHTERIFGVFQRLHSREQYEGTGIGLAICRRIAERHGGSVTARSAPGEGATFVVTLPIHPREEGSRP